MNKPALTPKAIFDRAHEISSPAERSAFLDKACSGDTDLRQKVEALLQALEDAGSFLETPAGGTPAGQTPADGMPATGAYHPSPDTPPEGGRPEPETVPPAAPGDHPSGDPESGTCIGVYRLVRELGAGGMGAVWLAEQEHPIRRQVALKLIKPGLGSEHVVARFEAERQALTMMEHPNIARVFDAGTTQTGQPFFVMELVQGVPMHRYCNENTLTPRERLELFVPVCQALQHAHQKGIMHRDVKPTNVLVAMQDGVPVPKVIDFGLAKAIEQPLTEQADLTQPGAIMGTLEYMSPEQADFSAKGGVDTRTDVYSLGVMMYELLTGTTPLDRATLKGAALIDVVLRITQEEAPRPSTRVASLGDRLPAIAAERRTEPGKLAKLLRKEVDWIALRALEKDRNRRYESAGDFGRDVQCFLDDEPVQACPPSVRYRMGKFVRKNRTLVGSVAVVVLLLVAAGAAQTQSYYQVKNALHQEVIAREKAEDAERKTLKTLLVTDAVIQVMGRHRPTLSPSEKAGLRKILYEYKHYLGEPGYAREERAQVANALYRLGNNFTYIRELKDAEETYRRAIQLYEDLVADYPEFPEYRDGLARSNFNLAVLLVELKKDQEAEAGYRRAIALHDQLAEELPAVADYRMELANAHNNLGAILRDRGELVKAEKSFQRAIALGEKLVREAPEHQTHLAGNYHNLGNVVRDQRKVRASLAWYGKAIALLEPIDPRTNDIKLVLRNAFWDRANALGQLRQHADAVKDWQRAFDLDEGPERGHLRHFLVAAQMEVKLQGENKPTGKLLYQAAIAHALATAAAAGVNETGLQMQYAARSLEFLKAAWRAGWFRDQRRIDQLKENPAFNVLPRTAFEAFLKSLNTV